MTNAVQDLAVLVTCLCPGKSQIRDGIALAGIMEHVDMIVQAGTDAPTSIPAIAFPAQDTFLDSVIGQTAYLAHDPSAPDADDLPDLDVLLGDLGDLVGLAKAKDKLREYAAFAHIQKLRRSAGITTSASSLHMAFVGNPGTGKTTVARLVAKALHQLGLVPEDKFSELQCSDLVGQYIGHTENRTREVLEKARGGVLFIDEAYSLNDSESPNDFGRKALTEIVAAMENYRDEIVIIFAGYTKKTMQMIESNPGLQSRLSSIITFDDYSHDELVEIAIRLAFTRGYSLSEDAQLKIRDIATQMLAAPDEHFGNGREMRTLLESAIMRQAKRLIDTANRENSPITPESLISLVAADFQWSARTPSKKPLGFAAAA